MGKHKIKIPSFVFDERFIIGFLFILAIAVRLLYKNGGLFHWDSLRDVLAVEWILTNGEFQYSYAYGAPGMVVLVFLFYMIHKLFTGTTSAESAYFFVTFVTAALCVVLVYLITKKFTKDRFISISAALLMCFTPIFLSVTTYPKTHSISLFFALASIYLMILYSEQSKNWMLALCGFCLGYSITIRIFSVLFILPLLYIYLDLKIKNSSLKINKDKMNIKNPLIFGIPAAAIWIVMFWKMIVSRGGMIEYAKAMVGEQSGAVGWQGFFSSYMVPSISALYKTMTIIGVILLFVGLFYGLKKNRDLVIVLLLWTLPFFFYFANIAAAQSRFFITFLPPLMIFIALGLGLVYSKHKVAAIAVLLLTVGMMFYTVHPFIKHRHDFSGTKEAALWMASVTEPNAKIMTNDVGWFIDYYGDREIFRHPRTGDTNEINEFLTQMNTDLQQGIPIYATAEGFAIDPGKKVFNGILANFDVSPVGEHPSEIYQYSELELRPYTAKLFKIQLKPPQEDTESSDTEDSDTEDDNAETEES
ncbi:glycosyltransferase family 39 protein [Thermoproteota archaeon]